jgi:hypothetical protein
MTNPECQVNCPLWPAAARAKNLEQAQKPQRQSLSNRSARQFRNFDLVEKGDACDI